MWVVVTKLSLSSCLAILKAGKMLPAWGNSCFTNGTGEGEPWTALDNSLVIPTISLRHALNIFFPNVILDFTSSEVKKNFIGRTEGLDLVDPLGNCQTLIVCRMRRKVRVCSAQEKALLAVNTMLEAWSRGLTTAVLFLLSLIQLAN